MGEKQVDTAITKKNRSWEELLSFHTSFTYFFFPLQKTWMLVMSFRGLSIRPEC